MNEVKEANSVVVAQPTQMVVNYFNPEQFNTMQRVCKMFANSDIVPDKYKVGKENPLEKAMANCMIAIEMALRIGASPLMIMQNMYVVKGKPSWSSKFLIATVNTCGRFNPLQYRFTEKGMVGMVDYNTDSPKQFDGKNILDIECVAFTTAKGSDVVLESSPISIRLAIKEGWYTKNNSKWQTMPKQMLMYRAASFWTNAYAPELSMGMRTVEEYQDMEDVESQQEVSEILNQEKIKNSNKDEISMEEDKDTRKKSEKVDTNTGEVKAKEKEQQPATQPGF